MAVPAQASQELPGAVADVCHRVKRMVECYEEGREPNLLDCLVFHVDRLRRILLASMLLMRCWKQLKWPIVDSRIEQCMQYTEYVRLRAHCGL